MQLICSVTPKIYCGIISYKKRYNRNNEILSDMLELSKIGIASGKLSIDFLAAYKSTFEKWEGYQDEFYKMNENWESLLEECKNNWEDNIKWKQVTPNQLRQTKAYKKKSLLDVFFKMRKLNDIWLSKIIDDDEIEFWKNNVERYIDNCIHMSYSLVSKMQTYIEKYGEIELKTDYDWNEESNKWLKEISES